LFSAISGSGNPDDASTLQWVDDPRKIIATILYIFSRGWLLLFLAWRAHERGGDSRFDEVLGKAGGPMQPLTFFVFWMAQAFWVYLISMPLLFINSSDVKRPEFSAYDIAFAVLFGCGVAIEILADIQKALWVRDGRKGTFCSIGIWRFSRHPNYFGEIFQWWCLWAFAYSSSENPNGGYADLLWWAGIGEFFCQMPGAAAFLFCNSCVHVPNQSHHYSLHNASVSSLYNAHSIEYGTYWSMQCTREKFEAIL
jgi:steroid 5-alpha reductase family enzyme